MSNDLQISYMRQVVGVVGGLEAYLAIQKQKARQENTTYSLDLQSLGLLSQLVIFGTASSSKTETCGSRTGSLARTETRDRGNIREKQKSCSNDGAWKMKLVVLASIYHR